MQSDEQGVPFTTVPIGLITKDDVMVSVCYHQTEIISDFIQHTRKRNITVNNKMDMVLRILYSSAYWFLRYLKVINNEEDYLAVPRIGRKSRLTVKDRKIIWELFEKYQNCQNYLLLH